MADAEDLTALSTPAGNLGANGVKFGETLTGNADGNAELRLVEQPAKCRDETAPSWISPSPALAGAG
jgi:hypothetical protein